MNGSTAQMSRQEQAIKRFLHSFLDAARDGNTIRNVLADIGAYFHADRSYIFELNDERTEASNTYEWCQEGISAEIENLQNIPLDGMESWFEESEETGDFYISSLDED